MSEQMNQMLSDSRLPLYEKAVVFAAIAHQGAHRKGSRIPYLSHPIEAAAIVSELTDDGELIAAAVLHDVVEDTDVTLDALREYGFNEDILMALDLVTKKKGPDYDEDIYYEKIKTNSIAREVKLADLKHNSDISRIPHPTKKDIQKIEYYKSRIEYLES